eukprot:Seg1494.10 transcript_id=Seg1494.10/GoldUCD/mRNA.D3Y31 product=Paxillin protein_id=Seg1494.10/GoldUCD/D3Y31
MADQVYDVCIIGAGIIGSCAAYNALKYTKNVLLCDQVCVFSHSRGSSHGHSRIIRTSYIQKHYSEMMPEAFRIWKEIQQTVGTELLVETGLLSLEDEPHTNVNKIKDHLNNLKSEFEYLDAKKLMKKFPTLSYPDSYRAIFEPSGGILKADKCCAAFQNLFKSSGGCVKECCKVKEIIPGDVVTIITNDSVIKTKSVILAAGPWTNDILRTLGLRLPLTIMKINVWYWKAADADYSAASGFPCFIEYTFKDGRDWHLYGLPNLEYPGLIKACAHYGNDVHPDERDEDNEGKEIEVVADYLSKRFKGVAKKPSIVDKCYYTWTRDEDFIIDYHPLHKNIVIGAGFSGHGFKLAPVTGKLLAQLAQRLEPDYDLSPFHALLADLQSTAGMSAIFDVPPPDLNGHDTDGKDSPSTASKPFSYSPIPPRNKSDTANSSISDLDSLLDDLGEKSPDSLMQHSNILSTKVEALLDELDSAVAPTPAPVVQTRPSAGRAGLSDEGALPSKTASSATKELDDLMASLSDFKVSAQRDSRTPTLSPPEEKPQSTGSSAPGSNAPGSNAPGSGGGMVSKTADYAKVDKNHQSFKGKQGAAKVSQLDSMLGSLQSDMSRQGVATVTKGVCAACSKPIVGQVCTALGRTWHPEHFTCAVCEVPLGTKTFFERDGKPYCEEDYHEQFAPRCAYCEGPILDACVTAMDQTWHPEHFVCAQCGKPFGESGYHEKDGKPFCREDYYGLFAPKCSGCDRAIMDNYISALNGHWHPECFVCMECHQPFQGGSFFEHEGMPYCEMHYHARRGSLCYSCQKPITGRCITAMHRKFHPEHFICAFCLKQLNKGTFKEQNDKPYCHSCFVKLFG